MKGREKKMKGRTEIAGCGVRRDAVAKAERGPLAAVARYALVALACLGLTGALALPVAAQTLSDDVTLSALVVNDGSADLPLQPTFNSATASFDEYYVDVGHDVDEVTVTATPNHSGATVEYRPSNVLSLEVGYQNFRIIVTSEDESENEAYDVGVFRAPPATPSCTLNPGDIWCSLLPVTSSDAHLFGASIRALSDFDFTYKGYKYRFRLFNLDLNYNELSVIFYPLYYSTARAALAAVNDLYLQVGSESFRFSEAGKFPSWWNTWRNPGLEWSAGTTVTVRLRKKPPEVELVKVTSWPQSGGLVYKWGDTILFTLTFSGEVRVEGQPMLTFDLGGSDREARFWGLSDTDYERGRPQPRPQPEAVKVHFGYTVQPGDFDSDGVVVGALSSAIRLGGARILSAANGDEVELSYAALGQLMEHTVDGGSAEGPAEAGVTIVDTDGRPLVLVNGEYRLVIPEGTSGRYGLKLNTRPTHPVDFSAIYGDGDEDLRVLPTYTPLLIAPDEWGTTFWVDIRASPDDDRVDGERVFQNRVHSKDPVYNDLILLDVLVVEDDDEATASATASEESSGERVFQNRVHSKDPVYNDLILLDVLVVEDDDEATASATASEESSGEDDLETSAGHSEPQEEDEITALTAAFADLPSSHEGTAFTFRVEFSEDVEVSAAEMRDHALTVTGGTVTGAAQVDGRADRWSITVTPSGTEEVLISLPPGRDCSEAGAVCTADGRELSTWLAQIVVGPPVEPVSAPDKPTGLEATASHDSVTLTWDDPDDDTITGYVILRRIPGVDPEGQFNVLVADTGTAATTYTDNTVSAETRYTYRIKAINGAGTSERSRWYHIDVPAAPVPAKPTGLEATASHNSVTLTWDDPGDDSITGYVILRRIPGVDPEGQFDELVADTGTAATTYTDDTVSAETRYTYRIKAINGAGTSERSRWYHIDTPAAPASKPAVADGPPGLAPNAPNPFNASTLIPYRLAADGPVRLEIYNLLGQSMRTLVDEVQAAGAYQVHWDARDRRGALVSAGMYLVRLHYYPGGVQTQRLLYLK